MSDKPENKIVPPAKGNGIVDGSAAADIIDLDYTGDPEGDRIDHGDALLPGAGPNDDVVDAGAGDDLIKAGRGDDTVYAGSGNDTVYGQSGNDVIYGDSNLPGGSQGTVREVFQWDQAPDPDGPGEIDPGDDLSGGFTQDTGHVTVSYSVLAESPAADTGFTDVEQNVSGIETDGTPAESDSGLDSVLNGAGNAAAYELAFSGEVSNVSFRINDVDGDGVVRVLAFDAEGNAVELTLTAGNNVTLSDTDAVAGNDTADSDGGYGPETSPSYSVLVDIPGPVARLVIEHSQDGSANSGITITDVYFDVFAGDGGVAGDDILDGGDGDDILYGEGGDDTLIGGRGNDLLDGGDGNDTITGGDGSDTVLGGDGDDVIDTSGSRPLPDRGFPSYSGLPAVPADPDIYNDRDVVDGGDGDDIILTGDDEDVIDGGAGNDIIDAGLDDDTVDGGDGDDFIVGGEGSDTISGGAGNDTIYGGLDPAFPDILNIPDDGSAGPADPDPTNGMDVIDGGEGDDTIYGQDDDDTIFGGAGDDYIDGGIDDDTLFGDDGDDTLLGGQGNDTIFGGQGADLLDGGSGADIMFGGDDEDTFVNITQGDLVNGNEGFTTSPDQDFDTLDLRGAAENANPGGRIEVEYDPVNGENGVVHFFDAGGTETGTTEFYNIEHVIPCFTPGTLIATPMGERRVEDLQIGDRVITRDNGIQEIRWVGRRDLTGQELRRAEHLQPVLITAGALGNGLPERDMLVSPNHRILIANEKTALYFDDREVLVAAKHLTGIDGIDTVEVSDVAYIHFMFDQHEVVLSDGAWSESFQPGDQTLAGMDDELRAEIFELFPELKTREGLEAYSAARRSLKRHEARLLVH